MWIILGVFFSLSALALEPLEALRNVKILRVFPDNVIMVNRGIEDGLLRNDHAKFSTDTGGFSSRGICIKVSREISYWKLYRIPEAEAFSLDYTYTIWGLADREIPFPVVKVRDSIQKISELTENKKTDPGPDPFAVRQDLPERLTERDLIKATGPEQRKLFIEETINRDQLQRDLEKYVLSFYASPFTRQSINEGEMIRYGVRGGNVAARYRLSFQFEQQENTLKDPLTNEKVSTRGTQGQIQFTIGELSRNVSSLSLLDYRSQSFSRLGTPDAHWLFGPLGFTWHLYESKTWEYMDLSYIPLYDRRSTEVLLPNGVVTSIEEDGLRHGFRFGMKTKINEKVAFENLFWVRPFQDPASWQVDLDNLYLSNDLKLIFTLSNNLFFDYSFIYIQDQVWNSLSNLPAINTINSINVRYDLNL